MRLKWIVVIAGIIVLLAGAYYWATGAVKGRVEKELSAACQRPVTIEKADLTLPAGIRLKGLVVPRIGREPEAPLAIGEIHARLVPGEAIRNRPVGDLDLTEPKLWMEWNPQVREVFSKIGFRSLPNAAVAIRNLKVHDGALDVTDAIASPHVDWRVRKFNLELQPGSQPQVRLFQAQGGLMGPAEEPIGKFSFKGTKVEGGPFEANVSLSFDRIQVLAPYLRQVLGPTPVQGSFELESRVTVHQGVLMAENQLTASGIRFATQEPTHLGPGGNRLIELLSDPEGKVHLGFIVKGPLGQSLDWSDVAASAMREAMRQAMVRSIQGVLIQSEQAGPIEERLRRGLESIGR